MCSVGSPSQKISYSRLKVSRGPIAGSNGAPGAMGQPRTSMV